MEITFEDLFLAYESCLKRKKNKSGTYSFNNLELCQNLCSLLDEINNKNYIPSPSNRYGITYPAPREIYAAQFKDRVVQHFYMNEINNILENELIDTCCSCRKEKGTDYALNSLKKMVQNVSENGMKNCFYLKIDLSGYFMSIDRQQISNKFTQLIERKYLGCYKDVLLYLTPLIFLTNPADNCLSFIDENIYRLIPERRILATGSPFGMAIGNLTAQAGSNLNLNDFDHYIIETLKLCNYVRYVDDIIIVCEDKSVLYQNLSEIEEKLAETNQVLNKKKTKIDTAYHGIKFLGRITYPYGYQKPSKEVIKKTINKAEELKASDENLLAKANSQIGTLKNHNCRKLIFDYDSHLSGEVKKKIVLNKRLLKYTKNESETAQNDPIQDVLRIK